MCPLFRTAMPYGGYEKASKRMTFQMPKFDLGPLLSEPLVLYNQSLSNRPSFNRTPIPWLSSGEHADYNVDIGIPLDGETEELWGVSSSTLHQVSPLWFQVGEGSWARCSHCKSSILLGMEGKRREKSAFPSFSLSSHSGILSHHLRAPLPLSLYGNCSFMEFAPPPVTVNKLQGNELILPLIFEGRRKLRLTMHRD